MNVSATLRLAVPAFRNWQEDNCLRLSAALAYYSIFSIAPLLVIVISMAGLFLGAKAAEDQIHQQLQAYVGSQAAAGVQSMVQSASQPHQSKIAAAVGVVTLLVGAAGIFGQLKDSLNTIWKVKQKPGGGLKSFFREHFLSFGMVLGIGFLLLTSLVLTAALSGASAYFGHVFNLPPIFWGIITFLISYSVVTVLFATIFKFLPDARIAWRNVWIGAVATAALFEIGKFGLGWYLGRPSTASTYGAAGSAVLLLLWVYYTSLILFFGAEFTRAYSAAVGEAIEPSANAERIAGEAALAKETLPLLSSEPRKEHPRLVLAATVPSRIRGLPPPDAPRLLGSLAAAAAFGAGVGFLLRWRETETRTAPVNARDALQHDLRRLLKEARETVRTRFSGG